MVNFSFCKATIRVQEVRSSATRENLQTRFNFEPWELPYLSSFYCATSSQCYFVSVRKYCARTSIISILSVQWNVKNVHHLYLYINTVFVYISIYIYFSFLPPSVCTEHLCTDAPVFTKVLWIISHSKEKRVASSTVTSRPRVADVRRTKRTSLTNPDRSQRNPPQGN